jgi:Fe-S cluster biogenesis protein NfuA
VSPPVDEQQLRARVARVCAVMSAHAGAIELLGVDARGEVLVRFTGMCTGCAFRPLTMEGTIRPALMDVSGVTAVHADGARISEEALARMRHYMDAAAQEPLTTVRR